MNTSASTKVEQRHRDAAAAHIRRTQLVKTDEYVAKMIETGECDHSPLVQAFARFEATLTHAPSGEGREWMPIESAPKDGTFVDLWQNGKRRVNCRYGRHGWQSTGGWIANGPDQQPTHWMPLPAPPHKDTSHD